MKKLYQPSQKILENYANILVNFALNNGNGIKKGEVIRVGAEESAKPLYAELRKAVWRAGGHVLGNYIPESDEKYNFERDFFTYTSDEQVKFFPAKLSKALIEQIDHSIMILSDSNPQALKGIDPKRIM
ncbi:MAG: aminopeptidase, partial [Candidatus Taylorbacteria bacterium]|nr:aminopeptidase [Candidatus Taylorbacteria bacterium]